MPESNARMTVTPEQLRAGKPCSCEACVRDGAHEPDCRVHAEPPSDCSCGRSGQNKGAG
jgi:hypothetical protein